MHVAIRVKLFVADYGPAIALALAIAAAACFVGAAVTYTSPPAETTNVQVDKQQFGATVGTSAIVSNDTELYEPGTELRDMPVYFVSASPNLTFHVEADVPDGQDVTVSKRLILHMEASRNGDQFWSEHRVILAEKQTVSDGLVQTNGTMNVSAVRALVADRRGEIGDVGQFRTTIRLNVSYETDQYTGTLEASTPLVTTGSAYWLGGDLAASDTQSTTETRRVVGDPDVATVSGFLGLGLLGLFAAGWVRRHYRDLDPRKLELELTRARHDEWISNGEIPTKSEKEYILVASLADLVDVAIDSNKRVIYDEEFDVYGVVAGDIVYHYSIGDENLTEWFDV